jgi:flagellar protein FliO/FliZ
MRTKVLSKIMLWSVAAGTLWLSCPTRVLAVGDNVEDALKKGNTPAGQAPAAPVSVTTDDGSILWSLIQLIFALGIIIAIIYLLIRFLSSRTRLSSGNVFQTIGAHSLTNNRSVHMVAVEDKVYLLGVGENITLLDTIQDADLIDRLKQPVQEGFASPFDGMQKLFKMLRSKSQTQSEEITVVDLPFDATLRDKLNQLKEQRQQAVDDWQEGHDR